MKSNLPQPLGRNHEGYHGAPIDLDALLDRMIQDSPTLGWKVQTLPIAIEEETSILLLQREAGKPGPRVMLSAGIHGDEPASTAALGDLILNDQLPRDITFTVFPCLNPRGMRMNRRLSPEKQDLNRDYQHVETSEVQTHIRALKKLPRYDLALQLHEDWEAKGFYLYELTVEGGSPQFGRRILDAVGQACPIETASEIEGLPADRGLIHPPYYERARMDWPEPFYLMKHHTHHCLTLEAPSDFDLEVREQALKTAVLTAVGGLVFDG